MNSFPNRFFMFIPEYAFDHLLLPKIPVKLGVNSVFLTHHNGALCLARETANFFGLLALMTKFKCVIRVYSLIIFRLSFLPSLFTVIR